MRLHSVFLADGWLGVMSLRIIFQYVVISYALNETVIFG